MPVVNIVVVVDNPNNLLQVKGFMLYGVAVIFVYVYVFVATLYVMVIIPETWLKVMYLIDLKKYKHCNFHTVS